MFAVIGLKNIYEAVQSFSEALQGNDCNNNELLGYIYFFKELWKNTLEWYKLKDWRGKYINFNKLMWQRLRSD